MIMSFSERLRIARQSRGLTQQQLAELIGVSRSTVAMWETGEHQPDLDTVSKLATILKVSVDFLLGKTEDPTPLEQRLKDQPWYVELRPIPVYNGANAGDIGTFPDDRNIVMWISVPKKGPGKYGVIVHGDSMEPDIKDGDIVVIDPDVAIDNGSKVIVIIDGQAYVKKIYFQNNVIVLQSLNSRYPPITIPRRKMDVYVVGRVVWVVKRED